MSAMRAPSILRLLVVPCGNTRRVYAAPARLRRNHWALAGEWTVEQQAVVLHEANGRIAYRFHARDLHLVMGPAARGTAVRFRVLLDGQAARRCARTWTWTTTAMAR